ncbi:alpha/beta fold hydrolase [Candidatus Woesearchaeota archaeon]|nr:alpha/beta fold hydrolase [Candidatus Woesearchaeota archaeon]
MVVHSISGLLVEFSAADGILLHGFLEKPKKRTNTCIIYIHGMGGNFYKHALVKKISKTAVSRNFAFFSMNTRGHDALAKSHSVKGGKKNIGTNLEVFEHCIRDIKGAINALKKLGFSSFILAGHSTGCQKVTYYQYKTKDRRVKALVLLAPADDFNIQKKSSAKKFSKVVKLAEALVKKRKPEVVLDVFDGFSAQRFLSIASPKRVESRLFNYDSKLKEFSSITVPVYACFGSKEEYATKPVKTLLSILARKTNSVFFTPVVVKNANHGFNHHEEELARSVLKWLKTTNLAERSKYYNKL